MRDAVQPEGANPLRGVAPDHHGQDVDKKWRLASADSCRDNWRS
jgi:hypothetical protein